MKGGRHARVIVPIAAVAILAGCGGGNGDSTREKAVAAYYGPNVSGESTIYYAASCDDEAQPSTDSPNGVYGCDVWHGLTDDGWYCAYFDSHNQLVRLERAFIDDSCA